MSVSAVKPAAKGVIDEDDISADLNLELDSIEIDMFNESVISLKNMSINR